MFGAKKLKERILALERENAELAEKAHQGWQILDMLTQENVFICDMTPPSGASAGKLLYYANANARRHLQEWRSELKRDLGIDVDRVVGSSIHAYHKDPERIRRILHGLKPGDVHPNADIPLGQHVLRSVSHPLSSRDGKVVGMVTTWHDVSHEKQEESSARGKTTELAQVAAAMEEMTATTEEVARNTREVSDMSTEAMRRAEKGDQVMGDLVAGMTNVGDTVTTSAEAIKRLGQRSNEIGKIVEVINDIADQTNMLALNAAIEAARAGEQGRGFAVVADEVRKLAERTTKATKEIGVTIKATQEETENAVTAMMRGTEDVEKGKALVLEVSEALQKILGDSKKVMDLMLHIASATEEQSRTVQEISENVERLAQI